MTDDMANGPCHQSFIDADGGFRTIGINRPHLNPRGMPLAKKRFATLISAYAPTLDAEHNVKEDFYRALDAILQKTPATDRLILMGDFTEHLV